MPSSKSEGLGALVNKVATVTQPFITVLSPPSGFGKLLADTKPQPRTLGSKLNQLLTILLVGISWCKLFT